MSSFSLLTREQFWKQQHDRLVVLGKNLLADIKTVREKNWDLNDEIEQLRREYQILDAENNLLRQENEKLQQDLGDAARRTAGKRRTNERAKPLVPPKRGPRRDGRPRRLCAAGADYRQYR